MRLTLCVQHTADIAPVLLARATELTSCCWCCMQLARLMVVCSFPYLWSPRSIHVILVTFEPYSTSVLAAGLLQVLVTAEQSLKPSCS